MSTEFFTGMAAFVSAIMIFCGSAFLLLMLILGARLAYFITASITLAFVFIMAVVWSINPLGPVGQLPEWDPVDIAEDASQLEGTGASDYPDSPWRAPNEDDDLELAKAAELEGDAGGFFEDAVDKGDLKFDATDSIVVAEDSTFFNQQGDKEFGATKLEVLNSAEKKVGEVVAIMQYDPGNPLGKARGIAAGTLLVFVLHLFGLSRAERKVKESQLEGLV